MRTLTAASWICTALALVTIFYTISLSERYGMEEFRAMPLSSVLIGIAVLFGVVGIYAYYRTTFTEMTGGIGGGTRLLLLVLFLVGTVVFSQLLTSLLRTIF